MAVMILLAVAHLAFWGYAVVLGWSTGVTEPIGVAMITVWLAFIGLWAGFVGALARSGWLAGRGLATFPAFWISAPVVTASLAALLAVPLFQTAWIGALSTLPVAALPALNSLRLFALGTVIKAVRGQMPKRIGLGVGIPDTLFGLWSLRMAAEGGFASISSELAWHITGATILLLMIPASLTSLLPPRLDAPGKGDARAILRFPLVLAPAGLALPFLILHVVAVAVFATSGLPIHQVSQP